MFEQLKNKDKITLPDWLSSGQDLFGTIQIIKGKKIELGYLEIDSEFTFSGTFNYPIIFIIRSSNSDIEADAIAFKIDKDKDTTQRAIEEHIIAPRVCNILRRDDFLQFFADVVEKDIDFALYLNKTPEKFKDLRIYKLNENQKIVFNERLILAITEVLDQRRANTESDQGLN